MFLRSVIVFFIFILILAEAPAIAQSNLKVIELDDSFKSIKLNSLLYKYHDKENEHDGPNEKLFSHLELNTSAMIMEPHSTGNLWLAFKVDNKENKSTKHVLHIDSVQTGLVKVYIIDKLGKIININLTGTAIRPKQRSEVSHMSAVEIKLTPKQEVTIVIKRISNYMFNGNIYLMTEKVFKKKELSDIIFLSVYFGATFALILYNLFVFFYSKNFIYLSYVEFTLSLSILLLIVFGGYDLFLYDLLGLNLTENISLFTAFLTIAGYNFCRVLFGKDYLPDNSKIFFKALLIISLISILVILSPFWNGIISVIFNYLYDFLIVFVILLIFKHS